MGWSADTPSRDGGHIDSARAVSTARTHPAPTLSRYRGGTASTDNGTKREDHDRQGGDSDWCPYLGMERAEWISLETHYPLFYDLPYRRCCDRRLRRRSQMEQDWGRD